MYAKIAKPMVNRRLIYWTTASFPGVVLLLPDVGVIVAVIVGVIVSVIIIVDVEEDEPVINRTIKMHRGRKTHFTILASSGDISFYMMNE